MSPGPKNPGRTDPDPTNPGRMDPGPRKKPDQGDPSGGAPPESGAMMKAFPQGPGPDLSRLRIEDLQDPRTADEALSRWDELDEGLLSKIEAHPQHGARIGPRLCHDDAEGVLAGRRG